MRLFVAINLPAEIRSDIWRVTAPLRAAGFPVRWVESEAVHLTLKFLGEVAPERRDEIAAALTAAAAETRRFPLPIGGFGAFPSVERPRVIWVGCEGVPSLELLQHDVELAMERLGFPVEGRPFRPHLTLGRATPRARPASFARLGDMLEGLEYMTACEIRSVDLMESRLSPKGARYQVAHAVGLAA